MAGAWNWQEILRERFPTFKVEEDAFIECLDIACSTEVYIEQIYEAIKNVNHVPNNLKALYHKAMLNGDKDVVKRIKNRISNIRRNCK